MNTHHRHHQHTLFSPIYSRIRACLFFPCSFRFRSSTSAPMGGKKKNKGEGGKNNGDDANKAIEVVVKVDMHCEGCCDKLKKVVKGMDGVEAVRGTSDTNKLTIIGQVDPTKLQQKIAQKTKKKVELISPKPNNKNKDSNGGGGDKKSENKSEKKEKSDDKKTKEKEAPVTTAVLKMALHCEGCVQKIHRVISKTKGYHSMSIDMQKDLVTVTGTMDTKALAESLKEKLKRSVEIVPPKKDKESGGGGGAGGDKGKKEKGGGGGGGGGGVDGGKNEVGNRMEFTGYGYGPAFGYAPNYGLVQGYNYNMAYGNGPGGGYVMPVMAGYEVGYPEGATYAVERLHAPQLFSDENPNACSIM